MNDVRILFPSMKPFAEVVPPENLRHHFVGQDDEKGVYAKEIHIPAGTVLVSHKHAYDHLSILASGWVRLEVNGEVQRKSGPMALVIKKGEEHSLMAITDTVWFCIHPTDETDEDKIDETLLARST